MILGTNINGETILVCYFVGAELAYYYASSVPPSDGVNSWNVTRRSREGFVLNAVVNCFMSITNIRMWEDFNVRFVDLEMGAKRNIVDRKRRLTSAS